jgi:hypothetical protein
MFTENKYIEKENSTKTKDHPHIIKVSKKTLSEDTFCLLVEEIDKNKKKKNVIKYPEIKFDDTFFENIFLNQEKNEIGLIPKSVIIEFQNEGNKFIFKIIRKNKR